MIDKKWMKAYAYKVKKCPKCFQDSFCLIIETKFGEEWECAESTCGWNPKCSHCKKKAKAGKFPKGR